MHQRLLGLRRKLAAELAIRDCRLVVYVRGKQRIVVVSKEINQPRSKISVGGAVWRIKSAAGAQPAGRSHRDNCGGQFLGNALQHAFILRASAVDLVYEHEGG